MFITSTGELSDNRVEALNVLGFDFTGGQPPDEVQFLRLLPDALCSFTLFDPDFVEVGHGRNPVRVAPCSQPRHEDHTISPGFPSCDHEE
jgi:hypothetical protein